MRYVVLMCTNPAQRRRCRKTISPRSCASTRCFRDELNRSGELLNGAGLAYPDEATVLRWDAGAVDASPGGPLNLAAEQLAAYYVIDCESAARARDIAERTLDHRVTAVELREVHDSTGSDLGRRAAAVRDRVASRMMELAFLSAVEQARLVREGEVSSTELVELSLARIEQLDPTLNAFVTVCSEEALATARGSTRRAVTHPSAAYPSASRTSRRRQASARRTRPTRTPRTCRTSTPPSSDASARPGS